jgi:hypothetical protein
VLHLPARFAEEQAFLRRNEIDPPRAEFPGDRIEIGPGIGGEQRQLESTFPGGTAVAFSRRASGLGEDRSNLVGEIKGISGDFGSPGRAGRPDP